MTKCFVRQIAYEMRAVPAELGVWLCALDMSLKKGIITFIPKAECKDMINSNYRMKSSLFELYRNIGDYIIPGDPPQVEIL